MDTKKKILDVALTLFSEKGYGNVYVGQIAEGVGIKAPSLYKHYKSKQDIFDAILEEMRNRYNQHTSLLNITGSDFQSDSKFYNNISEDDIKTLLFKAQEDSKNNKALDEKNGIFISYNEKENNIFYIITRNYQKNGE